MAQRPVFGTSGNVASGDSFNMVETPE